MKLIVGLGNPGKRYEQTRHNVGFLSVDMLAQQLEVPWKQNTSRRSEIAKTNIENVPILLMKPQTFMNLSGEAVQAVAAYYKINAQDILLVQDELDLAPGRMLFLAKGGPAGHNGIISIQEHMGKTDIARLRIGIGRPTGSEATENWVLGNIEKETLNTITQTPDAIRNWVCNGIEKAMNTWNRS